MANAKLALPLLAGFLIACPSKKQATAGLPQLGTTWVIIGAAGGGRALGPHDVAVKLASEMDSLLVPGSGSASVEMLYAGISEQDLPAGLSPDKLEFVFLTTEGSRPVPPLTKTQVLESATPPGNPAVFVAVDEPGLSDAEHLDRKERLDALLANLGIKDPCMASNFNFSTPRSQASAIDSARVMSTGDIVLGLASTSTAILGVLSPPDYAFTELGVRTGSIAIIDGEASAILSLGETEAKDGSGRTLPGELGLLRGGALGWVSIMGAAGYYLDNTPRNLMRVPSEIVGFEHLRFGGADKLCMFGAVLGEVSMAGTALGAIWCRDPVGGPWATIAEIPFARRFTALLTPNGGDPLAIDYAGAVYRYRNSEWNEVVRPLVNQGDDCKLVACASVGALARPDPANAGDLLAVVAGRKAETDLIRMPSPDMIQIDPIPAVSQALFGDERGAAAAHPIIFITLLFTPDQALWYGTDAPFLIRLAPDRKSASRVCLPTTAKGGAVTALAATAEGKLMIGMTPTRIGIGTWQWH